MAEGEHYVGTQGGGMDQAICILGKKGNAVKIDFFPFLTFYIKKHAKLIKVKLDF